MHGTVIVIMGSPELELCLLRCRCEGCFPMKYLHLGMALPLSMSYVLWEEFILEPLTAAKPPRIEYLHGAMISASESAYRLL